jgi:flagellin
MTVSINSNLSANRAQRILGTNSDNLNKVFERLSSGQRINRSSDDAAGLAIASLLESNVRIASVGLRNAQDGISTVIVADSALASMTNILGRLAELATQAANAPYSMVQRSALQSEFEVLGSELERIAVTTEFNGVNLLSGSPSLSFQIGFNGASTSQITVEQTGGATLQRLGLALAGSSALTFSLSGTNRTDAQVAARSALEAISSAVVSLNSMRSAFGRAETRLSSAILSLQSSRENMQSAQARIVDADVAVEAADLTRINILQQAGAAVLAQANQLPQLAAQLIR